MGYLCLFGGTTHPILLRVVAEISFIFWLTIFGRATWLVVETLTSYICIFKEPIIMALRPCGDRTSTKLFTLGVIDSIP